VAILAGAVGNLKAIAAAEQDAKNIVGVWRIDNLLKVRPRQRKTDDDMEKQLKAALSWDSLLDRSNIEVAVIIASLTSLERWIQGWKRPTLRISLRESMV